MGADADETERLRQRAEMAEQMLDGLLDRLAVFSNAHIGMRLRELEKRAEDYGSRIGGLESRTHQASERLDRASAAHEQMKTRIGRLEFKGDEKPQAAPEANAATSRKTTPANGTTQAHV